MAEFFTPGTTYIRDEPFKAPELLDVFRCVAVAEHPRNGELRAFGFVTQAYPGDKWFSAAPTPADWELGWVEYDADGRKGGA